MLIHYLKSYEPLPFVNIAKNINEYKRDIFKKHLDIAFREQYSWFFGILEVIGIWMFLLFLSYQWVVPVYNANTEFADPLLLLTALFFFIVGIRLFTNNAFKINPHRFLYGLYKGWCSKEYQYLKNITSSPFYQNFIVVHNKIDRQYHAMQKVACRHQERIIHLMTAIEIYNPNGDMTWDNAYRKGLEWHRMFYQEIQSYNAYVEETQHIMDSAFSRASIKEKVNWHVETDNIWMHFMELERVAATYHTRLHNISQRSGEFLISSGTI